MKYNDIEFKVSQIKESRRIAGVCSVLLLAWNEKLIPPVDVRVGEASIPSNSFTLISASEEFKDGLKVLLESELKHHEQRIESLVSELER